MPTLLDTIENIDRASTFAWAGNDPRSAYYETAKENREQYLMNLDKACLEYLKIRKSSMKNDIVKLANQIGL